MLRSRTVVALLVLAALGLCAVNAFAQAPAAHKIVGSASCKMCHNADAKGAQFKVWSASSHAKAFATLATPAALEAGKKLGVAEPQKDAKCLVCHTTTNFLKAAGDVAYKLEEGVGCEACHGAGSDYKLIMKDKAAAMKAGLVIPNEATCKMCHNEKSPTYKPFKFAEAVKLIAHPYPAKAGG
jgi:hypothetical protein